MKFITIDGDDVGRKITSLYLSNDEENLHRVSLSLVNAAEQIAELLRDNGFDVIFCAADGVVGKSNKSVDYSILFEKIQEQTASSFTFSAGVGSSLKEAYVALLDAKSNGKNKLCDYTL
ncbi:hypothetical protein ACS82_17940 [Vibrio parahaemolyticus]|uniref:mCpol domain-containing protein n=1 Tax=Vibrio parahaemolyticus TaxID=670 RepID=UPI0006A6281B|nr:mCpol domain-containing protein [Vibrio parahaemolyticus]KOC97951.1 hypothetical protein ACS82_17940 [Vibrio parahaemolyticus]